MVGSRSFRALAAILVVRACVPAWAGGAEGQSEIVESPTSGYLSVTGDRIDIDGALELDPCKELLAVAIAPKVKVAGLGQLKGTLRAGGDVPAGVQASKHYVVEGKLTVRDGLSRIVGEGLTGFVAASAPKPGGESSVKEMEGKLSLAWNGTRWSAEGIAVAQAGGYTADVEILLLRAVVDGSKLLREEILDRAVVRTRLSVGPKIDECRAWARVAPGLGKGSGHRVLVHGQPSNEKPWLTWRHNRPVAIFGNMGRPAVPTTSRLGVIERFLKDHAELFAIGDVRVVGTLRQESENQDPDGTVRLRLYQSTTAGSSSVRVEESAMTAVFDSTDEMVFLGGRFLENLPLQVPAAQLQSSDAVDRVIADLDSKGIRAGRDVLLLDQAVFGDGTAFYELAFRLGVSAADRKISIEPPRERDRTFEYWVSAASGRVLRVRDRTVSSVNPVVTVFDVDPDLVYGTDGNVDTGTEGALSLRRQIRIDDPTGTIFTRDRYWLEDVESATGVVSETFIDDPYDGEPHWYVPDIDNNLPDMGDGDTATQRETRKAFTAFRQVQLFWDRFGSRYVPAQFTEPVDLLVQVSDLDEDLGGQYQPRWGADNEIRMASDWLDVSLFSIPVYAAVHEAFHHLDWHTVDLEGPEEDGDYRMPGAIKDGLANAAMDWTDPHPVNNVQAVGASFFACLFGSGGNAEKLRVCLDFAERIFRKAGADPFSRPWGVGSITRSSLEPWPDCRTIDTTMISPWGCRLVLPPDQSTVSSFKHRDQANDAPSQYFFIQQVMLDLWETMSSVAASAGSVADGERVAGRFPDVAIKGFLLLDDEASFVDLRNAMRVSTLLSAILTPFPLETVFAVDDSFARHGIDATLESFCADEGNDGICH